MPLSLAEKAILLQYGAESQGSAQSSRDSSEAGTTEIAIYSRIIGALLMDALLQQHIRLKHSALFVWCRPCYLALAFGMLCLAMAILLGPAIASAAGMLSFFGAVAISIGLLLLWYGVFYITTYLITGRLFIEETPTRDEALALLLQRMRETGQAKTCYTYFRRLMRFRELREQVEKMRARLVEQGYITPKEMSDGIGGTSPLRYTMNLNLPECQELRTQFRAFLLSGDIWNGQIAALAILLSPRILGSKSLEWTRRGCFTDFTPDEYPTIRARFRAIKAQQDATIRSQFGATTYRALLTIRNLHAD